MKLVTFTTIAEVENDWSNSESIISAMEGVIYKNNLELHDSSVKEEEE